MVKEDKGKLVAYIRVSSVEQNEERQKVLIQQKYPYVDRFFSEKLSGRDMNRPQLKLLMEYVREGDTVVVESLSRISRDIRDCHELLLFFETKKVTFVSLKEQFDFTGATGKLFLHILIIINQFERELLKERQAAGIELAKARGAYKGRQKIKKPENFDVLYQRYVHSNRLKPFKLKDFLRETGLKYATLYRFIKQKEKENEVNL